MIVAHCATYPARSSTLRENIARLLPQVDRLDLVFNQYADIPTWTKRYSNLVGHLPTSDLKDTGKFKPTPHPDDVVILIDDDLLYPANYVEQMVATAQQAGIFSRGAIGGLHGTNYRRWPSLQDVRGMLRMLRTGSGRTGTFRDTYNFWEKLDTPTRVEQLGTGTVIMSGAVWPGLDPVKKSQRQVDVGLAQWAFTQSIPLVALPRPANWLVNTDQEETLYHAYTRRMPAALSQAIQTFAYKTPGTGKSWPLDEE